MRNFLTLSIIFTIVLQAQPRPVPASKHLHRETIAQRFEGTLNIDGIPNEVAWKFINHPSDFIQRNPHEGQPSTEDTYFSILYDDEFIYIAVKAMTKDPSTIKKILSRRDENSPSDWIFVSFDSYNDNRTAFDFGINPAGVKWDRRRFDDSNSDTNWDALWEGKISVDGHGWYVEYKIPFRELRFDNNGKNIWGIQISRFIAEKNEESYWAFWPKDKNGFVQHYGELHGLRDIPNQRRIYAMPYITGSYQKTDDLRTPVHPNSYDYANNIGLDAKIGITNNLTLDMTVNPDFGQVEADPAELNLSAFESYFEEKRPFFIEGGNIFNFNLGFGDGDNSSNSLFYTRRIGRAPHDYAQDDYGYETNPTATRILSAGKFSGKTSSGLSIGILDAVTARESGTVRFDDSTPTITQTVEPLTNYFVSRVQKDLREGKTTIGGIFTATNRKIEDDYLEYLHNKAYTGGLDFDHYLFNDNYEIEGALAFTNVYGNEEAIFATQTSSGHYFQRPNADHLKVDSTATNLKGFAHKLALSKVRGEHWRWSVGEWTYSPKFEANDLGFVRQSDSRVQFLWFQYRQDDPGELIRRYSINFNAWTNSTFGNERTGDGGNINGHITLMNYWYFGSGINISLPGYNINATWGGPAIRNDSRMNLWGYVGSDERKPISLETVLYHGRTEEGSKWFGIEPNITWRPSQNISVSANIEYDRTFDSWANWYDYEELIDLQTGDSGYIMSDLDQKTISTTLRLDLTLTPNLSIQYYGSPFITAGKYSNFKKLINPEGGTFTDRFYEFDNSSKYYNESDGIWEVDTDNDGITNYEISYLDFNYQQYNSNLVIRWEYKTGSTIYLVWSQGASDYIYNSDLNYKKDMNKLFKTNMENVILLKFSYLLNI